MGSVVVSVDAELGWGFHDYDVVPMDRIEAARDGWRRLLDLFDEYRIPATWAVVSHLFLSDCDGVHADHPLSPDWFGRERNSWRCRPELRFGGELISALLDADVQHDVGCHTFSHVPFNNRRVTPEVVRAELSRSVELAEAHGVECESFVFPRNAVGYRELLAEAGFVTYRGARPKPSPGLGRAVQKLAPAVDPNRVRLVDPTVDEFGLVDVPPSLYLFGFEGVPRTVVEAVWTDPIVRQFRHGVDRAAAEDRVFHAWLHPNDIVSERDVRRMRAALEYVDRRRRDGGVVVETMADVAARVSSTG